MTIIDCAGKSLDLSRPRVMGILNVTPDSFSDGGDFVSPQAALERARRMVGEGADIIDVGGESTRPGARPVPEDTELKRVIPVIEAIASELSVAISIDTSKPGIMRAAVAAGAGMINDVMALQEPGALEAVRDSDVPVCLMHMQGRPRTMQQHPRYDDVVQEVMAFLRQRVEACITHGIPLERLVLDPGFGFGKQLLHNLQLLGNLEQFSTLGLPLLVGISRKSMIGAILGDVPVDERLYGSLAAAVLAADRGAAIIRTHDVGPTVEALKVVEAVADTMA
jgi:dihydropteroate synthase